MDVEEFLGKVHIAYKGKGAQKAPAFGTVKADQYLSVANDKLRIWAEDPKYGWNTLFVEEEVTYNGNPIDVPSGFVKPAGSIELHGNNQELELKFVSIAQRKKYKNCVYLAGHSPKQIKFTNALGEVYIGSKVVIPHYVGAPKLKKASQKVICDRLDWLILATAAELARNDPAKDDQFGTLNGLANVEYRKMIAAATLLIPDQPNDVPHRKSNFNMGGPAS